MPRKRMIKNQHLPSGLYKRKLRGEVRFKFRKTNGKEVLFPKGTIESDAIDAAIAFNREHRNPLANLLTATEAIEDKGEKLNYWIPIIIERVRSRELKKKKIVARVFRKFELDMDRLMILHSEVYASEFCLNHVNSFLQEYVLKDDKSDNVYDDKICFLEKVFDYLKDLGAAKHNYANDKLKFGKADKLRIRLKKDNYLIILNKAEKWLQIAMRLSLQTTHAAHEMSIAKYKDCIWLETPTIKDSLLVYGVLRIQRKKVIKSDACRVEIPITQMIKDIIDDSRKDNIASPYIVHRLKDARGKDGQDLNHPTQCRSNDISESFTAIRDELGVHAELEKEKRPTFHEIRALSIKMYRRIGINPQKRASHSSEKTTKKYEDGHDEYVPIEVAELVI
jgi:enterobacteria phage integrase